MQAHGLPTMGTGQGLGTECLSSSTGPEPLCSPGPQDKGTLCSPGNHRPHRQVPHDGLLVPRLEATGELTMSTGHEHRSRGETGGRGERKDVENMNKHSWASESPEAPVCDPTDLLPEPAQSTPQPRASQVGAGLDGTPNTDAWAQRVPSSSSSDSEPLPGATTHWAADSTRPLRHHFSTTVGGCELPTSLCPVFIKPAVITPTASNTASLNKHGNKCLRNRTIQKLSCGKNNLYHTCNQGD